MDSLKTIQTFCNEVRTKAKGIIIDEIDTDIADDRLSGEGERFGKMEEKRIAKFNEKQGIRLDKDTVRLYYLASTKLIWRRPETKEKEGYLPGGFAFNGLTDIFDTPIDFWEKSVEKFIEVEKKELIDYTLLAQLRWIESPTATAEAWYTPQFGCVRLREGQLPDEFYFYDSGLVYPLPFKSYDEYIRGLTDCAAVTGWQYFFVDPGLVVSRNRGVSYLTWSLHISSHLEEGIDDLVYKKDAGSDRLDLINEYLERCVRLLPGSFPFIDFSFHRKYYSAFQQIYHRSSSKK